MTAPWLGHENGCISQYTDFCDCIDPNNPVDLAATEDGETTTEDEVPDGA